MLYVILLPILLAAASVWFYLRRRDSAMASDWSSQDEVISTPKINIPTSVPLVDQPKTRDYSGIQKVLLMDSYESAFFDLLTKALPQNHIFPQVAFSAIMQPDSKLTFKDRSKIFGFFAQKRFDYVICDKLTLEVIACIELDGKSHESKKQNEKDKSRDELVRAAGYEVHRFSWRRLHVTPSKTRSSSGKKMIYEWSAELRAAIELAKAARPVDISPYLFCNKLGESYVDEKNGRAYGWASMWQRFMERVLKETNVATRFTEHDLRAKAASDAETVEHARALLAHADSKITSRVYRRKPEVVKPLR